MTEQQRINYNRMLITLRRISRDYASPDQLRDEDDGLDYEERLEYAYENIQADAELAYKGVREIKP